MIALVAAIMFGVVGLVIAVKNSILSKLNVPEQTGTT